MSIMKKLTAKEYIVGIGIVVVGYLMFCLAAIIGG